MIKIRNMSVTYGNKKVLSINDEIEIKDKERIGIIGSNGAGKTTLVNAILGLAPYKGIIETDITHNKIAVHMQFNNYTNNMKIRHIIEMICNTKIEKDKKLQELIEFFEFKESVNKRFQNLSGGQKQRLTLILVMYQEVPLVFFDEVTTGLDFVTREKLINKIEKWYKGKDTTICMISHYYDELENLVDKLLILEKGEVVAFDYTEELFKKFCGENLIILENNEKNRNITEGFNKILSPENSIALSSKGKDEELIIVNKLIKNNVDFKRTNKDIELISINAKAKYFERETYYEF
ncbi:ATP-binding cassette domain-containing protein [Miniphocaeibacter massiliensis]|uniref:ATP-binding cassette domain-containing protein n=1 Tax=Miniphocaeibacter massiliensis TaxID=2041841 RepID=UPI000C1BC009|nr:ABC transporter ATP-binding protein [Miniphocaeibacter massiliensis]